MYVVGIDLSINYPGICISDNFETFEFIGIVNNPRISAVNLNYLLSEPKRYDGVSILNISENRVTHPTYHVNERNKLINFHRITSTIINEIFKRTGGTNTVIAMEGISYGSKGSSLLDLCMLTGMLRHAMLTQLLQNSADRLFVFAPSELKNAIGLKGTALKTEVLAQFLDEPGIEAVRGTGMYSLMSAGIDSLTGSTYVYNEKRDEIGSPFNDMIDAYLSVLKLYESYSQK